MYLPRADVGGTSAPVPACNVCAASDVEALFEKYGRAFVRCTGCGLERIEPPPSPEVLADIYGQHYYDAWGLHDDEAAVAGLKARTFRTVLAALGPVNRGEKLLDCGAATGFLMHVARDLGYEPYGVELSAFGAQAIARSFGPERAHQGDLLEARFAGVAPGEFDVVTMCDFIEHVRDPRAVLRHARGLLRAGGTLVITTPDTGSLSRRLLGTTWSHYRLEHLHYFNRNNLGRLLRDVGFGGISFRRLRKSLSLDFVSHQLERNPHPLLTRVARAARRVAPRGLSALAVRVSIGEIFVIARVAPDTPVARSNAHAQPLLERVS